MTETKPQSTYTIGERDTRPWGIWEVIAAGTGCVVKRITVKPSQKLSLQWHHHRGEHWVITAGHGDVTLGEDIKPVVKGDAIFIPKTVHHRMTNSGNEILEFIEIQMGDILDEADIERIEDIYGRTC